MKPEIEELAQFPFKFFLAAVIVPQVGQPQELSKTNFSQIQSSIPFEKWLLSHCTPSPIVPRSPRRFKG